VIAVNEGLEDEPEMVNSEPYDGGWFYRLKPADLGELDSLLNADDYSEEIAE